MKPVDCKGLYKDGRYYDLENEDFVDDIPFYIRQSRKFGEPVLELACGTGRITIPLAEKGIEVLGLDISNSMLAQARKKAAEEKVFVQWVRADCRLFSFHEKFNLIFLPFNSIAHLHDRESIEACFSCVKKHLTETGGFIIDIFNPRLDLLNRDASQRYRVAEYSDPDGRGKVVVTEDNIYDAATQLNRVKWYYKIGGRPTESIKELNMRIYYPQELDALLHYNGFTIESKYGDYDETPYSSSSPKQIVVCSVRR